LADTNLDVRVATENLLSEFLREIKIIAQQQEKHAEARRSSKRASRRTSDSVNVNTDDNFESAIDDEDEDEDNDGEEVDEDWEGEGSGAWEPGQSVVVDHAQIMDIIVDHLSYPGGLPRNLPS